MAHTAQYANAFLIFCAPLWALFLRGGNTMAAERIYRDESGLTPMQNGFTLRYPLRKMYTSHRSTFPILLPLCNLHLPCILFPASCAFRCCAFIPTFSANAFCALRDRCRGYARGIAGKLWKPIPAASTQCSIPSDGAVGMAYLRGNKWGFRCMTHKIHNSTCIMPLTSVYKRIKC